jgi:uncharacterized protein YbjT (DUF2867 family)
VNTVLVVGATGSIGRLVVAEALQRGLRVRALVRDLGRARALPAQAERVVGELTQPAALAAALEGVDAVVFTHGSHGSGQAGVEAVDYGAVRNLLLAWQQRGRPALRISLMTAIGVTDRQGAYNRATGAHDWKRRGERLLRASGLPYTVVRPGWFDHHAPDQHRLTLLQGDTRHAGNPSDGVIARSQIAQVLVASLLCDEAVGKTFELVAERGAAPADLAPLLGALAADRPGELDGVRDARNLPLADEPAQVRADLEAIAALAAPVAN